MTRILLIVFILSLLWIAISLATISTAGKHVNTIAPKADKNGLFTEAARAALAARLADTIHYWKAPDTAAWKNLTNAEEIRFGRNLIVNTAFYFGDKGLLAKNYTNGMNCQNCHLEAGTKIWGNNYSAVAATYPKYRARSGKFESIAKRVNDCFERSLNGKAIDSTGQEMKAIIAYIKWLGTGIERGVKPMGSGFQELDFLERAASPSNGKNVYERTCKSCHGADGQGQLNSDAGSYQYPPLWGEHSYNKGAGLYRISNFARYVKFNMPNGANYLNPQLSDEDAWDVAAFVNSQTRPDFATKKDWPNLSEKPVDAPFGPYSDRFTEQEHKYGPYVEMLKQRKNAK